MKQTFSDLILSILKRVAASEFLHERVFINEDGALEMEMFGIIEGQVAPIASINENSTEVEITQFELQLDLFDNAVKAQDAEDAENEVKIREILGRLTPEERLLIERPLPEDLPSEDEGEEHF
jgi:hypothetical protein